MNTNVPNGTATAGPSTPAQKAVDYARKALRIVPLYGVTGGACECGDDHQTPRKPPHARGKHPRIKNWAKSASADPATVEAWARRWPRMNIGAAMGAGIFDVEVDLPKGGGEWEAANLDRLPATWMFTSGTGGHHRLYSAPTHVPITTATNVLATGVDVRGDGGQCVLPHSTHYSGAQYKWVPGHSPWECEIADAPAWLVEAVRTKEAARSETGEPVPLAGGTSKISDLDLSLAAQRSTIGALWFGHIPEGKTYSELDYRLVSWLLWRNGGDVAQADQVFRMSPAFRPERWDSPNAGGTYGSRTLYKALDRLAGKCYSPRARRAPTPITPPFKPAPAPELRPLAVEGLDLETGEIAGSVDTGEIIRDLLAQLAAERAARVEERAGRLLAEGRVLALEAERAELTAILGNSKLVPGDKLAAVGIQKTLAARGVDRSVAVTIDVADLVPDAAQAAGVSTDTVNRLLTKQSQSGDGRVVRHEVKRTPYVKNGQRYWNTESRVTFAPSFFNYGDMRSPTGKEGFTYGGARVCPVCGSTHTQVKKVLRECLDCHNVYNATTHAPKPQIAATKKRESATAEPPAVETADCGIINTDGADCGHDSEGLDGLPLHQTPPLMHDVEDSIHRMIERQGGRLDDPKRGARGAQTGAPGDGELAAWPPDVGAHICDPPPGAPPRPQGAGFQWIEPFGRNCGGWQQPTWYKRTATPAPVDDMQA